MHTKQTTLWYKDNQYHSVWKWTEQCYRILIVNINFFADISDSVSQCIL